MGRVEMVLADYPKEFPYYYRYMYTYDDDVPFWKDCLKKYSGVKPLIYVGPGVGRLLVHLLKDSDVVAIDRSPVMRKVLSDFLESHPGKKNFKKLTTLPNDVTKIRDKQIGNLVILPCNVLTELNSCSHIKKMLKSCHQLLADSGHLVVEIDNGAYFKKHCVPPVERDVNVPNKFVGKRRTTIQFQPREGDLEFIIELMPASKQYGYCKFSVRHYAFSIDSFRDMVDHLGFDFEGLYGSIRPPSPFTEQSTYIVADLKKRG